MGKRGEVVEELEEVVKFYRERLLEEKAVEDSVEEELEGAAKPLLVQCEIRYPTGNFQET